MTTIFALSSGAPPAAIAVVRISGPDTAAAITRLTQRTLPAPRRAVVRKLLDESGSILDQALLLWFPAPGSATGEDLAELHLHGGRAVVAAVLDVLGRLDGLTPAAAGEFTRRALLNGRIDLTEAEGLAELLRAESEWQRRQASAMAGGATSRRLHDWRQQLLKVAAKVEAEIDFADEDDVAANPDRLREVVASTARLRGEIRDWAELPSISRWRDGVSVVIAGPPNAGKSTLLNALADREAAIVSAEPGTTRDVVEVPIVLGGATLTLTDTAGLREGDHVGAIEEEGIKRAEARIDSADIVLWLGDPRMAPARDNVIRVAAQIDRSSPPALSDVAVSARTGEGMGALIDMISARVQAFAPSNTVLPTDRQKLLAGSLADVLPANELDPLLLAEELRSALELLSQLDGRSSSEAVLDELFTGFCIGK